jgi:hypothetical protein
MSDGEYTRVLERLKVTISQLIRIEENLLASLKKDEQQLQSLNLSLAGVDSVLAQNLKRDLEIKILTLNASITGAEFRRAAFIKITDELEKH